MSAAFGRQLPPPSQQRDDMKTVCRPFGLQAAVHAAKMLLAAKSRVSDSPEWGGVVVADSSSASRRLSRSSSPVHGGQAHGKAEARPPSSVAPSSAACPELGAAAGQPVKLFVTASSCLGDMDPDTFAIFVVPHWHMQAMREAEKLQQQQQRTAAENAARHGGGGGRESRGLRSPGVRSADSGGHSRRLLRLRSPAISTNAVAIADASSELAATPRGSVVPSEPAGDRDCRAPTDRGFSLSTPQPCVGRAPDEGTSTCRRSGAALNRGSAFAAIAPGSRTGSRRGTLEKPSDADVALSVSHELAAGRAALGSPHGNEAGRGRPRRSRQCRATGSAVAVVEDADGGDDARGAYEYECMLRDVTSSSAAAPLGRALYEQLLLEVTAELRPHLDSDSPARQRASLKVVENTASRVSLRQALINLAAGRSVHVAGTLYTAEESDHKGLIRRLLKDPSRIEAVNEVIFRLRRETILAQRLVEVAGRIVKFHADLLRRGLVAQPTVAYYGDATTRLKVPEIRISGPHSAESGGRSPLRAGDVTGGIKVPVATRGSGTYFTRHIDGSTVVHYPSGRPAILQWMTDKASSSYCAVILDDTCDHEKQLLAVVTSSGRVACNHFSSSRLRLIVGSSSTHSFDAEGEVKISRNSVDQSPLWTPVRLNDSVYLKIEKDRRLVVSYHNGGKIFDLPCGVLGLEDNENSTGQYVTMPNCYGSAAARDHRPRLREGPIRPPVLEDEEGSRIVWDNYTDSMCKPISSTIPSKPRAIKAEISKDMAELFRLSSSFQYFLNDSDYAATKAKPSSTPPSRKSDDRAQARRASRAMSTSRRISTRPGSSPGVEDLPTSADALLDLPPISANGGCTWPPELQPANSRALSLSSSRRASAVSRQDSREFQFLDRPGNLHVNLYPLTASMMFPQDADLFVGQRRLLQHYIRSRLEIEGRIRSILLKWAATFQRLIEPFHLKLRQQLKCRLRSISERGKRACRLSSAAKASV